MISIVGHMSGGKTYTAVRLMMDYMASGHVICTNIRLNCKGVTKRLQVPCTQWKQNYYYISDDESGYHILKQAEYENYPAGSVRGSPDYNQKLVYIFLDEVSSYFDSITHSGSSEIRAVAAWARHTEKRGQMVYLIMQFSSDLHKRLRNHVQEVIGCVNTTNLKIPVINLRLPSMFRGFILRTHYADDGETKIHGPHWDAIEPAVYDCYYTSQIVVGDKYLNQVRPVVFDSTFIVQRKRRVYLCQVLILGVVLWFMSLLLVLLFMRSLQYR